MAILLRNPLLIVIYLTNIVQSTLEFSVASNTLPQTRSNTAWGIYNDFFIIVGGTQQNIIRSPINESHPNYTQWEIISYNIGNDIQCNNNCGVIFHNRNEMYIIGRWMNWGNGENWDLLYKSYRINLNTLTLQEMKNWTDFTRVHGACITSNGIDKIYVVGGKNITSDPVKIIQMYDVSTGGWIERDIYFSSIPAVCEYYDESIYVFPDVLYLETGNNDSKYIRKLHLTAINIQQPVPHSMLESTDIFNNSPPYPTVRSHSFAKYSAIDNTIYYGCGMLSGTPDEFWNDIYALNVLTDKLKYLSDPLSHPLWPLASPAVFILGTKFTFMGGITQETGSPVGKRTDIIQYATIPTPSPTSSPTASPSLSPTDPSLSPTDPSLTPTASPSLSPTDPSLSPTDPSLTPTSNPTIYPTNYPSNYPNSDINSEWILKVKGENCGDGYQDLDDDSLYFGVYCKRCSKESAGTNGKCHKCGTLEEPNHSRTECEFYHPWWLYLLETIAGLTCIIGIITWIYKHINYTKTNQQGTEMHIKSTSN